MHVISRSGERFFEINTHNGIAGRRLPEPGDLLLVDGHPTYEVTGYVYDFTRDPESEEEAPLLNTITSITVKKY